MSTPPKQCHVQVSPQFSSPSLTSPLNSRLMYHITSLTDLLRYLSHSKLTQARSEQHPQTCLFPKLYYASKPAVYIRLAAYTKILKVILDFNSHIIYSTYQKIQMYFQNTLKISLLLFTSHYPSSNHHQDNQNSLLSPCLLLLSPSARWQPG